MITSSICSVSPTLSLWHLPTSSLFGCWKPMSFMGFHGLRLPQRPIQMRWKRAKQEKYTKTGKTYRMTRWSRFEWFSSPTSTTFHSDVLPTSHWRSCLEANSPVRPWQALWRSRYEPTQVHRFLSMLLDFFFQACPGSDAFLAGYQRMPFPFVLSSNRMPPLVLLLASVLLAAWSCINRLMAALHLLFSFSSRFSVRRLFVELNLLSFHSMGAHVPKAMCHVAWDVTGTTSLPFAPFLLSFWIFWTGALWSTFNTFVKQHSIDALLRPFDAVGGCFTPLFQWQWHCLCNACILVVLHVLIIQMSWLTFRLQLLLVFTISELQELKSPMSSGSGSFVCLEQWLFQFASREPLDTDLAIGPAWKPSRKDADPCSQFSRKQGRLH